MLDFTSLIFIAFVVVVFLFMRSRYKALAEVYQQQAAKRNGRVKKMAWLIPSLTFYDEDREVSVYETSGSKNSPPHTHLKCKINPMREFDINIGPEHVFLKIGKRLGMQDIQIGTPEFDESFLIRGSDEMAVRSFLAPEIQESILGLKERSPTVRIQKKSFHLEISSTLNDEQQHDHFIDAGLKMLKKAVQIG